MPTIYDDVTALIGHTPLVRLNRITDGAKATVLAKLEFYNPASSVKDRIGVSMIDAAEASGQLKPQGAIVEATSGNTGIALAMVGAARGYKVILTMPETMSKERRGLLRAFGAELVLTPGSEGMKGAVAKAEEIGARDRRGPGQAVRERGQPRDPPQHDRRGDLGRHRRRGRHRRLPASAPAAPSPASGRCSRSASPSVQIIAVEPEESPILNGGPPGPHKIQGIGANFVPEILDREVYDEVIDVNAETSVKWARRAAAEEGLLVGMSSGAALAAAIQVAQREENAGKTVVVVIPSFGERYLSTILYSDLMD